MKKTIITLLILVTATMASAAQNNFEIQCASINKFTSSAPELPLAYGESWEVRITGNTASKNGQSFTMVKTKNGQRVEGPYSAPAKLNYLSQQGQQASLSFSLLGQTALDSNGIFTIDHMPLNSLDPFIMYGWSKVPLTVMASMEYRCKRF